MDRVTQLEGFLNQDPANRALALDYVDALVTAGRVDDARHFLEEAPLAWLVEPAFLFRVSRCALATADYAAAVEPLRTMLSLGEEHVGVRHDLAYALLAMADLAAAEDVLAPLVPQAVAVPEVGILHARVLQHRFAYDDAALILEAVVAENPDNASAWGLLAMIEVDRVRPDVARFAAGMALALEPAQPDALTAVGTLALWTHDAEASYAVFAQLLATQPHHGRALAGAGEALLLRGDVEAAQPLLARATAAMPGHLGTWHARAWANLLAGDVETASRCFDAALDKDRNFGETHGGLALVHVLRGEQEQGRQAIRVALRLDASGRNARYAQSLLWRAEGREREAEAMVDGILAEVGIDTAGRPTDFIARLQARLQGTAQN